MKTRLVSMVLGLLLSAGISAQAQNLEAVLNAMDKAAESFHTAQANFVWDQYEKVVDDHEYQKGTIYFRKQGNDLEMASDITSTDNYKKYLLFSGGKMRIYEPKLDQLTEYDAGKNKAAFESFLLLGFGGRGHDLAKSFDVKSAGTENVDGVNAAKLELTPKSDRVHNMFPTILLWIDPARGVSVQQKFIEPSGSYRLTKYSNIQINQKIPPDVFKLKTTSKTKVIKPSS